MGENTIEIPEILPEDEEEAPEPQQEEEIEIPEEQPEEIIKTKGYLDAHDNYVNHLTDADPIITESNGYNILSLAIGRTPIGITPNELYPNYWGLVVGKSGITRKTSERKLAESEIPSELLMPTDFTPESLCEILSAESQGLISKDEIGGFLEIIKKKDYMASTGDLLMQLYDCPTTYQRKLRSALFELEATCFNILSATTPTRFQQTVNLNDFMTGFLSRFLVVYAKPPEIVMARRNWSEEDTERREECRRQFRAAYEAFHSPPAKHFELSKDAQDDFVGWEILMEEHVAKMEDETDADIQGAQIVRASDYILKVSAVIEVDTWLKEGKDLKGATVIEITLPSMLRAKGFIERVLANMDKYLMPLLKQAEKKRGSFASFKEEVLAALRAAKSLGGIFTTADISNAMDILKGDATKLIELGMSKGWFEKVADFGKKTLEGEARITDEDYKKARERTPSGPTGTIYRITEKGMKVE